MRNKLLLFTLTAGVLLAARTVEANAGDLYEADFATGQIFRFTHDRSGQVIKLTFRSDLDGIRGIAFDRGGDLFVAQSETIIKIAPSGATTVLASGVHGPDYLTTDSAGNVYASDRDGDVLRYTPDGIKSVYVSGLRKPSGLAFDAYGNLFVADTSSNSLYRVTPSGERTIFASGLSNPQGVAIDRRGNVYVANGGTNTIEAFNTIGSRFTFAYNVISPIGVAINSADDVFVAEDCGGSDRIEEFTPESATGITFASDLGCPSHLALEPPRDIFQNISTRAEVRSEMQNQELIGGFIIAGSEPKPVLIRALGPSLTKDYGIFNPLPDPTLELHRPDGTVTTNDNWMQTQRDEIESTGLAPKDYRESAILAFLDPGIYTAVVRGKPLTPDGIALVEVYDLDPTKSTLANISTRGFVESTSDNVMIGGFFIGGINGAGRVMVRVLGPSLGRDGVSNPLRDPTLELHNADGTMVIENDDWADDQPTEIYATGIQPPNSKESAIVATLPSGAYTAIVRGLDQQGFVNGTGVALIEVYNIR